MMSELIDLLRKPVVRPSGLQNDVWMALCLMQSLNDRAADNIEHLEKLLELAEDAMRGYKMMCELQASTLSPEATDKAL